MKKAMIAIATLILFIAPFAYAQKEKPKKTFAELSAGLERIDGFIPLLYDAKTDEMYLEVTRLNSEFLYQISLPTGVGSNPIGLDRGQLGNTHIVYFERAGRKLLLV